MRLPLALLALAAALALAACSDDGDPEPTPTIDFAAAAGDLVPDTLLTLADLPAGWETLDPQSDLAGQLEFSPGCDILDPAVTFPDAAATARSDSLRGPEAQQVISFGAIFTSEAAATAGLAQTGDLKDACEDEFKDLAENAAKAQLDALGVDLGIFADINVSLEDLDIGPVADEARAYRLEVSVNFPGADQRFTLDVLLIRDGRSVAAATYALFGEPTEEQHAIVTEALAANLAAVEAALP